MTISGQSLFDDYTDNLASELEEEPFETISGMRDAYRAGGGRGSEGDFFHEISSTVYEEHQQLQEGIFDQAAAAYDEQVIEEVYQDALDAKDPVKLRARAKAELKEKLEAAIDDLDPPPEKRRLKH